MSEKKKISVLIITYNEINHIEDLITNISFADEIIVIDSFSTDGTFEKLSTFNHVKTIQREFKNFADQRNFAIQQSKHPWILFIDADERIPESLKNEILNEINTLENISAYMFKRIFYFKQKRIRFSGMQTDKTYRLFKKNHVKYIEGRLVHEIPKIDGKSKVLKNKMIHYSFNSAEHYKSKIEYYARLKATELSRKGKKPNIFHFYIKPIYKFLANYIFRLGFLDGIEGFKICYITAYGIRYRYKELDKLLNN